MDLTEVRKEILEMYSYEQRIMTTSGNMLNTVVLNGMSMIETIKSIGAERAFYNIWRESQLQANEGKLRSQRISAILSFVSTMNGSVLQGIQLFLGAYFVLHGSFTLGSMALFQGILNNMILSMLKHWLADEPELYAFIMWLITRNLYYRNGKLEEGFTSVLPGSPIVPFLQNIYMIEVDRFMNENVRICSRYTDDICMICEDAASASHLMEKLKEIITGLNLTFNEEKTGIISPGDPYDLLGIRFLPGQMDIAENTFRKVFGKMKHRADSICRRVKTGRLTREDGIRMMANYINRYYYGPDRED